MPCSLKTWLLWSGNGPAELLCPMVLPLLSIYLHMGIHLDAVGLVVGLASFSLASGFCLGARSDRMGRRTALVASRILTVVSLAGFALVRTVWGLPPCWRRPARASCFPVAAAVSGFGWTVSPVRGGAALAALSGAALARAF